jgi:polyhydroxyalkanoate synthesis repressor PhaR
MPDTTGQPAPITIKKYANRRLYNTATSSYVTLDNLCQMVKDGADFVVYDAKTGEDITRAVLTQIIVEEEGKGQNLLPISFLRQLIAFYGDSMQWLVPSYLENSMRSFAHNQEQMRRYMQETFGGIFPFGQFEQMGKQNMAMIERAMKMVFPFGEGPPGSPGSAPGAPGSGEAGVGGPVPGSDPKQQIEQVKRQLDALQRQLDSLTEPPKPAKQD